MTGSVYRGKVTDQLERIRNANRNYVDTALRILELAEKAHSLYSIQDASEKRKWLRLGLSKSTQDNGTLGVTYNKPFDLILKSGVEANMAPPSGR
jgi:hypothetical protein